VFSVETASRLYNEDLTQPETELGSVLQLAVAAENEESLQSWQLAVGSWQNNGKKKIR
jgi:hypothetical protein